jgi:hypothetical protein
VARGVLVCKYKPLAKASLPALVKTAACRLSLERRSRMRSCSPHQQTWLAVLPSSGTAIRTDQLPQPHERRRRSTRIGHPYLCTRKLALVRGWLRGCRRSELGATALEGAATNPPALFPSTSGDRTVVTAGGGEEAQPRANPVQRSLAYHGYGVRLWAETAKVPGVCSTSLGASNCASQWPCLSTRPLRHNSAAQARRSAAPPSTPAPPPCPAGPQAAACPAACPRTRSSPACALRA